MIINVAFFERPNRKGSASVLGDPMESSTSKKAVIHFESSDERNSKGRSTSESVLRT
jgi:hypothetical protein